MFHPRKKRIVRRSWETDHLDRFPGVPPLLRRIYASREVLAETDVDHSLSRLPSPSLLAGMGVMVEHLSDAIARGDPLLIVADFDADGATSCAIAMRGLKALGAASVDFIVPNRFQYGYGLTPEIVALLRGRTPGVLITVDNGISSLEGVDAAKALGWRVLVTDHHLPGKELPAADAIVNPNVPGDSFPSKSLAGVGVMFYVLIALRARLREQGAYAVRAEPNIAQLLDYVALGTVADVVALDRVNRILVQQGLQRIRSGAAAPGLSALLQIGGRDPAWLTAEDLAFSVAPRLNAAGRLDDMALGIRCLLADDPGVALAHARRLDELNVERRQIEQQMQSDALTALRRLERAGTFECQQGLCLYDAGWHQGVIGLLASKIKDRCNRPVIAFAPGTDSELKGSARSIPGVHMRDLLSEMATRNPGLLTRFGGHAMAAGLSIAPRNLEAFRTEFADAVATCMGRLDTEQKVWSDGLLPPDQHDLGTAEMLRQAGPWGQAFPEPSFDAEFEVLDRRIVGERHLKMTLGLAGSDKRFDAIAFQVEAPESWLRCRTIRAAYRLDVNDYRAVRRVQLKLDYMEAADAISDVA